MRKFAWVLGTILLASVLVVVGCAAPAATPPATTKPAEQPKVTSVQGTIEDVNISKSTVVVETPAGPKPFTVTPSTSLTLNGQACTLAQLDELQASGQDFDCTVVYDEEGTVLALNVYKITPSAAVKGTISDVNIKDSTVTVKTASGDKVYDVDPETGLLIGGVACSLELINALLDAGGDLSCTVIYSVDDKGTALFVDIASPPNIIAGVGTVESVDVEKSTVTLTTDKGERTFVVNAKTGEFLNGEVCSLADIDAANELGATLGACQVLYYTDKDGKLLYIDISQSAP